MHGKEEAVEAEEHHHVGAVFGEEERPDKDGEKGQQISDVRIGCHEGERQRTTRDHQQPQDYWGEDDVENSVS